MPRVARRLVDGCCYHILNRGNARQRVFHDDADFQSFMDLLAEGKERFSVDLFAYCLMPNHFHLLLGTGSEGACPSGLDVCGTGSEGACPSGSAVTDELKTLNSEGFSDSKTKGTGTIGSNSIEPVPEDPGTGTIGSSSMEPVPREPVPKPAISKFMQWVTTTHVRRYHRRYRSSGHVWQGRFKGFLVQEDNHLLTVARYVESNPLRAGLVARAVEWPWSSIGENAGMAERGLTTAMPVPYSGDWAAFVDEPLTGKEQGRVSRSLLRQIPFGSDAWLSKGLAPQVPVP